MSYTTFIDEAWKKKMNRLLEQSNNSQAAWEQAVDEWCEWAINNPAHPWTTRFLQIFRSKIWSQTAIDNFKEEMKTIPQNSKEIKEMAERFKANFVRVQDAKIQHSENRIAEISAQKQ